MAKQKKSEPLTGDALLQKVKTLATLSKTQKAKACGYDTVTKGGVERVYLLQFLQALIEAEGIAQTKPLLPGTSVIKCYWPFKRCCHTDQQAPSEVLKPVR